MADRLRQELLGARFHRQHTGRNVAMARNEHDRQMVPHFGLANEQLLTRQIPFDQKALNDRTEAVRIATIQHKAGRRDLLWVAQLQTAQLATEANFIKLQSAQRVNRVRLHQALGGSFDAVSAATLP